MRCKLLGLTDKHGNRLANLADCSPKEICASIIRLEDHPILGAPKGHLVTRTSAVRLINFECGYFVTLNSVYEFGEG